MRLWPWRRKLRSARDGEDRIRRKYATFRRLLSLNDECLELLAALQEDMQYVPVRNEMTEARVQAIFAKASEIVEALGQLSGKRYPTLSRILEEQRREVERFLAPLDRSVSAPLTARLSEIDDSWAALVGGKAAMLATVRNQLGVRVPDGFVVTTEAYRQFLGIPLWTEIRSQLRNLDIHDHDALRAASARLTQLAMEQALPRAIEVAISERARLLARRGGSLAVRSSALGEGGGEKTYAGQYLSLLNVPPQKAVEAYRRVVAARFSERALFYRLATGLQEVETPMAVLFVLMLRARASGVMYTRDPSDPKRNVLWITATRGLGPDLASGRTPGDLFVMSRGWRGSSLIRSTIVAKDGLLEPAGDQGLVRSPLPEQDRTAPSVTADVLERLADVGIRLERHFGPPQDIEWVVDEAGDIWIVQTRDLALAGAVRAKTPANIPGEPLLKGGQTVYPGRVSGAAFLAEDPEAASRAPSGAILFVRKPSPEIVQVFDRIGGLVAEWGNLAGHVAALLREFKVPSVFLLGGAFETLRTGTPVSLDAVRGNVYGGSHFPGRVVEERVTERYIKGPGDVVSRRVLALNLLDPGAINFRQGGCKSLHDVLRYCHETAVLTMFTANDLEASVGGDSVKRLKSGLPMDLYVLDLGGGLRMVRPESRTVLPEEIVSRPFASLWRGFNHPGVSWTRTMPATLSDMASVLGKALTPQGGETRRMSDRSYLLVADEYLNMNSRLAFHFALVDACLSDVATQNYISFRFAGGGATRSRRSLRACFIEACLRHYGFRVERRGDLVNAWLKKMPAATTDSSLDILGRLMACTCQLDMYMTSEAAMRWYVRQFLDGNYAFRPSEPPP